MSIKAQTKDVLKKRRVILMNLHIYLKTDSPQFDSSCEVFKETCSIAQPVLPDSARLTCFVCFTDIPRATFKKFMKFTLSSQAKVFKFFQLQNCSYSLDILLSTLFKTYYYKHKLTNTYEKRRRRDYEVIFIRKSIINVSVRLT